MKTSSDFPSLNAKVTDGQKAGGGSVRVLVV